MMEEDLLYNCRAGGHFIRIYGLISYKTSLNQEVEFNFNVRPIRTEFSPFLKNFSIICKSHLNYIFLRGHCSIVFISFFLQSNFFNANVNITNSSLA